MITHNQDADVTICFQEQRERVSFFLHPSGSFILLTSYKAVSFIQYIPIQSTNTREKAAPTYFISICFNCFPPSFPRLPSRLICRLVRYVRRNPIRKVRRRVYIGRRRFLAFIVWLNKDLHILGVNK